MANKKILLIGGGGHCRSVLDSLLSMEIFDDIGIIERSGGKSKTVLGVPVVGVDEDLEYLFQEGWRDAFITLGSVGNSSARKKIYGNLQKIGFKLPSIVDPTASLGRNVTLGSGVFVGKQAVVNVSTSIGECAIINTGAIVEHDCEIGRFVHVGPGGTLCGGVHVGDDSHIGAGAVVRQQISIGSGVLVGAGSVVVKPLPDDAVAFGNPCKVVK